MIPLLKKRLKEVESRGSMFMANQDGRHVHGPADIKHNHKIELNT